LATKLQNALLLTVALFYENGITFNISEAVTTHAKLAAHLNQRLNSSQTAINSRFSQTFIN
jgi:hypothetical protein